MPKSIAGKNPISRLFNVLLPPLNKFILKMPRKLRPKRITINPEIKFTAPLYSRRKLPMVPAKVPIATKITVNPLTNPNAPNKVFFCAAFSTTCKIGDIDGQHGKQAGRYEGDNALQESYCVLHEPLHPFPKIPDNSQPIKPV